LNEGAPLKANDSETINNSEKRKLFKNIGLRIGGDFVIGFDAVENSFEFERDLRDLESDPARINKNFMKTLEVISLKVLSQRHQLPTYNSGDKVHNWLLPRLNTSVE
jgi:hypothetical protein